MKKLFYTAILLAFGASAAAQGYDPLISLYKYQPLNINPALTGNMDAKWRMSLAYRDQWQIIHRPYRDFMGSFDINLPINAWNGNIWGFGINVVNDDQGDAKLVNRRYNLSFSLGQYLDPRQEHSLSVGFQGGLGQRAINYDNVYWDNQWAGQGFALYLDPGEPLISDVKSYLDLSTGIQYSYSGDGLVDINGGLSMYHFNTPDVGLFNDTANTELQQRNNVHFEMVHRIRKNSMFATKPSFLYSRQHDRGNLIVGNQFMFLFNEGTRTTGKRSEASMSLGLFGRFGKASTDVIGSMILEIAGFTFGAAYDIPVGTISQVTGAQGAFELMIGYRSGYRRGLFNSYSRFKKGKL